MHFTDRVSPRVTTSNEDMLGQKINIVKALEDRGISNNVSGDLLEGFENLKAFSLKFKH